MVACLIGALMSLAVGPVVTLIDFFSGKAGCSRDRIGMVTSPDDIWVSLVQEEVCSDGFFQTTVVDIVQLVPRGAEPTGENDVFAVDAHGAAENRPIPQWLSSQELQITIPNKSLIDLRKNSYQGIDISIRFDHDDPIERQQFLKSLGLDPE
jgi:hypothetical protein